MIKRNILGLINVLSKGKTQYAIRYDFKIKILRLGYAIEVPEDVRHMVKCKETHTGNEENGLHEITIENQSSCPAVVTFFEFEE